MAARCLGWVRSAVAGTDEFVNAESSDQPSHMPAGLPCSSRKRRRSGTHGEFDGSSDAGELQEVGPAGRRRGRPEAGGRLNTERSDSGRLALGPR
ncbi:MAG: hypothetical protein K0S78_2017 [Thermomicrobiales bacterium]|jgi:hypothetical protein|nr:hypothetical protein [Thermomicrobiales bacterium]MDF3038197.1 hypothetical protein [Thermomicrobiales bacterium]